MSMKIVDIANEIYVELGKPKELSIPPIVFWLRNNIGGLNNQLNQDFVINSTSLEIERTDSDDNVVEIANEEKAVYKKMYLLHYYDVQIRGSLGAASTDTWVEISSDGTSVRRVNKIEQSKTYQVARSAEQLELDKMIYAYKMRLSSPIQVAGDDTVAGDYAGPDMDPRTDIS